VSLLDQRAGSPPSAVELLRRNMDGNDVTVLVQLLRDWEVWVADLLESHLSYPVLAYFRSQHENQSWVAVLAVILDVSAYLLACGTTRASHQAAFTFAVGRHAVADLTNVLAVRPQTPRTERLAPDTAKRLWQAAQAHGIDVPDPEAAQANLTAIRAAYEPYLEALSSYLVMPLPPWTPVLDAKDNWETTAWDFVSPRSLLGPGTPFRR
jgi:hypothetical protein